MKQASEYGRITAVVGLQFGSEGKGGVAAYLSRSLVT